MDSYILRAHTDVGMGFIEKTASLILRELDASVKIVDHRKPNPTDFGITVDPNGTIIDTHVSLDKFLAEYFGVHYFQISRIFDGQGNVINRLIGDVPSLKKEIFDHSYIHVIDTDMVDGQTIKLAMKLLDTNQYTIPIKVEKNQDLIDMEDLYRFRSLIRHSGGMSYACYLDNPSFFTKRTSLPEHLFRPMFEIFQPY